MIPENTSLDGQVAIITGGGRGLGRAVAQRLAAAGASVAIVARSGDELAETENLIRDQGGHAMSMVCDVTDWQAVSAMAHVVEQEIGAVDILINNAGVSGTPCLFWEADPNDWLHTIDVNLGGAFLCTRAVLPAMVERKRGRIFNMASSAGLFPLPNGHSYCVSKAALVRFTDCLALDTQPHGIAVFAIDPGTVQTAMTEYLAESEAGKTYLGWFGDYVRGGNVVPADLVTTLILQMATGKADRLSGRFIQVTDNLAQLIDQADQIQRDDLYSLRLRK